MLSWKIVRVAVLVVGALVGVWMVFLTVQINKAACEPLANAESAANQQNVDGTWQKPVGGGEQPLQCPECPECEVQRPVVVPVTPPVSAPPVQEIAVKKSTGPFKGTFVGLVGVEGVGHHLFFSRISKTPQCQLTKEFHNAINKPSKALYFNGWKEVSNKATELRNNYIAALEGFDKFTEEKTCVVDFEGAMSYPYGEPRDTLRRLDLLDMTITLQDAGYDVKFLVIYRDPTSAVLSVMKRWPQFQTVPFQAKVVEDNLAYLSAAIRVLDPAFFYGFNYDDFVSNHEIYIPPVAEFLGIRPDDLEKNFRDVHSSTAYKENDDMLFLKSYFSTARCAQWSTILDMLVSPSDIDANQQMHDHVDG